MELSNTTTTPTNTHIVDSCCVISKQAMRDYLLKLRESVPDEMAVCQRDVESMVREWRSHNLFYKLGIVSCFAAL